MVTLGWVEGLSRWFGETYTWVDKEEEVGEEEGREGSTTVG